MSGGLYAGAEKIFTRHHLVGLAGNQGWGSFPWNVSGWFQNHSAQLFPWLEEAAQGLLAHELFCFLPAVTEGGGQNQLYFNLGL